MTRQQERKTGARLIVTRPDLERLLLPLTGGGVGRRALGVACHRYGVDLFVRPDAPFRPGEPVCAFWADDGNNADCAAALPDAVRPFLDFPAGTEPSAFAGLGFDISSGTAFGVLTYPGAGGGASWRRLDSLRIVGPGLTDISLRPPPQGDEDGPWAAYARKSYRPDNAANNADDDRESAVLSLSGLHSRLTGALGETAFSRWRRLSVLVVGCGGLGSVLAEGLARLIGPEGELVLLDRDTLEAENLPAWNGAGWGRGALGRPKSEILADALRAIPDGPRLIACVARAQNRAGRVYGKSVDILICCADNAAARRTCAEYAARYLRPLLTLETGIFLGDGPAAHRAAMNEPDAARRPLWDTEGLPALLRSDAARAYLADIRLILPAGRGAEAPGCLLCAGGVVPDTDDADANGVAPFWRHRAGTLPALNQETAGRALRLLTRFLDGHVRETVHLRLDDRAGGISGEAEWYPVAYAPRRLTASCPLCALLGAGDAAETERPQNEKPLYNQVAA